MALKRLSYKALHEKCAGYASFLMKSSLFACPSYKQIPAMTLSHLLPLSQSCKGLQKRLSNLNKELMVNDK